MKPNDALREALLALPPLLAAHVRLTVLALLAGVVISLPLAILIARRPWSRSVVLTTVGIIQTIPGLAMLALMVPLLASLSLLLKSVSGREFSALGFAPVFLALMLYSMLPIIRNTVEALKGIDGDLLEAARGLGMTASQSLWRVELPLASPLILAGVRTSAVWVVGTATLATPVGQRCLGNAIFQGLQTRDWVSVVTACIAAAGLAVLLDRLFGWLEAATRQRSLRSLSLATAALTVVIGLGWFADAIPTRASAGNRSMIDPVPRSSDKSQSHTEHPTVRIGAKTFTEQYLLAELMSLAVRDAGFQVEKVESLGSSLIFDALLQGRIDCYIEYTGTLWTSVLKRSRGAPGWRVSAEVEGWLAREYGIRCLGALGFENAYALAMPRAKANAWGVHSIADLSRVGRDWSVGGDYEFFGRGEWAALRSLYSLQPSRTISYDPSFLYTAAARGDVDVISSYSTDGRIQSFDLIVLDDPKDAVPPYDAVILVRPGADQAEWLPALERLVGSLDLPTMQRFNGLVDREQDKLPVSEAARRMWEQVQLRK